MLQFSINVLGADVFIRRAFEGITAEGEKSRTEENGLKAEEMLWERKESREIEKTQGQISKDVCILFQMCSCVCYLSNLCPSLEAQFTCHLDHTHTRCLSTHLLCDPWNVTLSYYAYIFEEGSCKWHKDMCCWLYIPLDLLCLVQFLGVSAAHGDVKINKSLLEEGCDEKTKMQLSSFLLKHRCQANKRWYITNMCKDAALNHNEEQQLQRQKKRAINENNIWPFY